MSNLSQFFGSGANETPGGISIPADGVPVEILGVAGSGGRGGFLCCGPAYPGGQIFPCHPLAGEGGAGALFHATDYHIQPGCTVPITIGGGGSNSACPTGAGGQGGATGFWYPIRPLYVKGGGGGGACSACTLPPAPDGTCRYYAQGCPGGNGGGSANFGYAYGACPDYPGGDGCYWESLNEVVSSSQYTSGYLPSPYPFGPVTPYSYGYGLAVKRSDAKLEQQPWGVKGGFPGNYSRSICSTITNRGYGGKSGGNATYLSGTSVGGSAACVDVLATGYHSSIAGPGTHYNTTGTFGATPVNYCSAGVPGGLIISWPTAFGSAPSFPGASDISPQTIGKYTYCFTSSGSITLP